MAIKEDYETDIDDDEVINVAEYIGTKPNKCHTLKRPTMIKEKKKVQKANQIAKEYSFDLTKANEIFDALIKDGQIKLSDSHIIPPQED